MPFIITDLKQRHNVIDRENRDKLIAVTEKFLNYEIDSFEFDDEITEIANNTNDKTVTKIRNILWHYYDDAVNHKASLTKIGWDTIWRFMLILKSDKELILKKETKYTIRQVVALIFLIILAVSYLKFGFNTNTVLIYIIAGFLSMSLSWLRENSNENKLINWTIYPFPNITELLKLKRKHPTFKKPKFNQKLQEQKIRNDIENGLLNIVFRFFWFVFTPAVLIYQSMPEKNEYLVIKGN